MDEKTSLYMSKKYHIKLNVGFCLTLLVFIFTLLYYFNLPFFHMVTELHVFSSSKSLHYLNIPKGQAQPQHKLLTLHKQVKKNNVFYCPIFVGLVDNSVCVKVPSPIMRFPGSLQQCCALMRGTFKNSLNFNSF